MADEAESEKTEGSKGSGCCSKICGGEDADKHIGPPKYSDRRCTDVLFLLLFFAYVVALAVISYLATQTGDANMLRVSEPLPCHEPASVSFCTSVRHSPPSTQHTEFCL